MGAFEMELSVMAARGADGSMVTYDPAENRHRSHILDVSIVPARMPAAVADDAAAIARKVAEALDYRGIMGVEFFLKPDGSLLVNEIAPRPHNSGHHTLDACVTSQFEQQLRMVLGLPAGSTRLLSPVVMLNLLGDMWPEETTPPDWLPLVCRRQRPSSTSTASATPACAAKWAMPISSAAPPKTPSSARSRSKISGSNKPPGVRNPLAMRELLDAAVARRTSLITEETNAVRLIDGAGDGLPGLFLESFDGRCLLSTTSHSIPPAVGEWLRDRGGSCHWKRLDQHQKESPAHLSGPQTTAPFLIRENGISYEISFQSGYSQGALDCSLGGFGDEAGDLPLHRAGGGQALCLWPEDKEQFRIYMRMMENFSGCRVLAYCVMCNHFHLLLEVTPRPKVPLTDEQLLKRLGGLYSKAFVATVAKELAEARQVVAQGAVDGEAYVQRIHERFTYRMHDLSEFMKTLLQRFTRWHNKRTKRRGNLWEETFKSVIVEDGWRRGRWRPTSI
jgi:REP element-mobilizing transposase RayT